MKKSILALFLVSLLSFNTYAAPPWWATACADGIAGYGGVEAGGAGGSIIPGAGTVAGAVCGGLFCAICGSVAYYYNSPVKIPNSHLYTDGLSTNPANAYDFVGIGHNELVAKTLSSHESYTMQGLYTFSVSNFTSYAPFDSTPYTNNAVEPATSNPALALQNEASTIVSEVENNTLTNAQQVYSYLIANAPNKITSLPFELNLQTALTNILSTTSVAEFNSIIIANENSVINDRSLTALNQEAFEIFFSVLRNSANFWATNGGTAYGGGTAPTSSLGIDEVQNTESIGVFPNPATTEITLNLSGFVGTSTLSLFDIAGKLVWNSKTSTNGLIPISLSGLSSGLYMLKAEAEDGSTIIKKVEITR